MSDIQDRQARQGNASEQVAGKARDMPPGSRTILTVRNMQIGVFNVKGTYYALRSTCPHQFGPLCHGPITGMTRSDPSNDWRFEWTREGEILTCPWHGMQFDITDGQSLTLPDLKIRTYPVRVVDGDVVVQLGRKVAAEE